MPNEVNIGLSALDLTGKVTMDVRIGGGGFSDIFKGTLRIDGDEVKVAVKQLRILGIYDIPGAKERLHKRFFREARLWQRLQHPNVVPFLGYMRLAKQSSILISPLYGNGDIIRYLERFPDANRRGLALDTVSGVEYLHSIPIAHGDLKGENVLVDDGGHAMLCDFGMSHFIEEADRLKGLTTPNAHTGGSDRFMSPEILNGDPKTTASDMWAAGCLVVQILTDIIPYQGIKKHALYDAITGSKPPLVEKPGPIEGPLWCCIKKCWSDSDGRPRACELRICLIPASAPEKGTDTMVQDLGIGTEVTVPDAGMSVEVTQSNHETDLYRWILSHFFLTGLGLLVLFSSFPSLQLSLALALTCFSFCFSST